MSGGFAGMRGAVERSAQSMDALTASMRGLRPQENRQRPERSDRRVEA